MKRRDEETNNPTDINTKKYIYSGTIHSSMHVVIYSFTLCIINNWISSLENVVGLIYKAVNISDCTALMKELLKYGDREKGICRVSILEVIHPLALCDWGKSQRNSVMTTGVRGRLEPGIFRTQEIFWNSIQYTTASKPVISTIRSIP